MTANDFLNLGPAGFVWRGFFFFSGQDARGDNAGKSPN